MELVTDGNSKIDQDKMKHFGSCSKTQRQTKIISYKTMNNEHDWTWDPMKKEPEENRNENFLYPCFNPSFSTF